MAASCSLDAMVELSRCAAIRWVTRDSSMGRHRVPTEEEDIDWLPHEKCQSIPHPSEASPERCSAQAQRITNSVARGSGPAACELQVSNYTTGFRESRRLRAPLRFHGTLRQGARLALRRQPHSPFLLPPAPIDSRTLSDRSRTHHREPAARLLPFREAEEALEAEIDPASSRRVTAVLCRPPRSRRLDDFWPSAHQGPRCPARCADTPAGA